MFNKFLDSLPEWIFWPVMFIASYWVGYVLMGGLQ